ncbi:hypothetical protein BDZ85DRAFT_282278 [Elsinoe ampelina]|uniref:Uncharacterized protein n=1 Tax=Elsinoe ampelina TaxID=302913 RepID=A0A6A6GBZ2_9PEZI|nr:hypothetical protein BDZ85DRAFT_282278 [Elsinoe ampelina]
MAPNGHAIGQRVHEITLFDETAIAWCNLPDDEMIVLFTPVVPPPSSNGSGQSKDPFEDLGRALGSIHPGPIRHVPYLPKIGVTDTHVNYIDQTATIMVVVCEPAGYSSEAQQASVDQQTIFARNAMSVYHRIHEGTEPDALILLYCGRNSFHGPDSIGTCLRVDGYTGDYWPAVANKVLRGQDS